MGTTGKASISLVTPSSSYSATSSSSRFSFLSSFLSNISMLWQEGKAYLGWEKIKDFLRNEEHGRVNPDNEKRETPLGKLKYEEFIHLRKFYPKNTPWVRAVFCLLAAIISLWDFMLLCTVLYFHMMIEKVVASGLAVLSWFALYKFFYRQDFSPGLPGSGPFK